MENFNLNQEKKELPRKLLGTLTFTRHSETEYTEKYPDITPSGIVKANRKGRDLKSKIKNEDDRERHYVSSPTPRAVGTNDILKHRIRDNGKETHLSSQIRSADIHKRKEVENWFRGIYAENPDDPKASEKAYMKDERFDNRPDAIEPREKVQQRAMRALEYLIRSFDRNEKPPHVIATSHFEIINLIVNQIFPEEEIYFGHVEGVEVNFYETEDENLVSMKVAFRGKEKEVQFDRAKREIIT